MKSALREKLSEEFENLTFKFDQAMLEKLEPLVGESDINEFVDKFLCFYMSNSSSKSSDAIIQEFSIGVRPFLKNLKAMTSLPTPTITRKEILKELQPKQWIEGDMEKIYKITPKQNVSTPISKLGTSIISPNFSKTSTPSIIHGNVVCEWGAFSNFIDSKTFTFQNILDSPKSQMFQKLTSIVSYLDSRMIEVAKNINNNKVETFHQLGEVNLEECYAFGRIASNPPGHRLMDNSIHLEGGLSLCEGYLVKLDISQIETTCLFPGQIVITRGIHPSTTLFEVSEIITENAFIQKSKVPFPSSLTGLIISGPFYSKTSPNFDFINPLCELIENEAAQIAILVCINLLQIGPFCDDSVFEIEGNEMSFREGMNQIFQSISEVARRVGTQVLVVPSVADITSLPIFPQTPFFTKEYSNIRFLGNPTCFKVNGFCFGVSSMDILMHLSNFEFSKGIKGDRISRLIKHLLNQKSFYPLYPPFANTPIDFKNLEEFSCLKTEPDILILTSMLCPFIKKVDNTLCINPSQFCKSAKLSFYANFKITSNSSGTVDQDNSLIQIHKS
ncbi:DNA polymerase alpha subunit B [Thelohanellus kitauei]|uniref:DNA polymerase alpha subunit B n=1 Tax=Thelohanellus kitauei TaxID=669202 RepID=A0A0C2MSD9_THEKT|nr:DNA polymerase alpha subunit B [Thelohanellus kitauei]